jgi:PAS domain S-box-containing protein
MRRTFDKGVLVGIGLVVALLIVNAGLAYRNTRQLLEDTGWVAHTHKVLDLAGGVLRTLVDAETGQRGFVITGKDNFLEPYHQAVARLDQEIRALRDKTRDNARQQARIEQLEKLTADQTALLEQAIDLRRGSAEQAQAFVASGKGKENMDAIRRLVAAIEDDEHGLLREREQQSGIAYRNAVTTAVIAAAVGLGLVAVLVYLVRRSLNERVQAAAVVHEQRQRLLTTLTSIGDAVIVTDSEGRVTLMNRVAQALTGWQDEALGRPLTEVFRIVNEQTRRPVESPVTKVIREGAVVGLANHTVLIRKGGTEVPIDDSGAPIRNAEGEIIGVVLVFRDVTERRRVERLQRDLQAELERQVHERTAELRASEERFRLLIEGTQDYAILMLDPEGRVASWNPGAERIKGYRPDEIVGQHFSRFYTKEAVDSGWPAHELDVARKQGRFEDEGWRVRKDGSRFCWANVIITALRDDAGNLRGFSKITRDLTERRKAEEALRQANTELEQRVQDRTAALHDERELLRVTLASIGDAVITTDTAGRVTFLNSVAESLTGWTEEQARGQSLEAVFPILHERSRQPVENPVARVLREGTVVGLGNHTVLPAKDGVERPIEDSAAPIKNVHGATVGVVLIFRDVTEQRQAQAALKRGEQASRFLADASKSLAALVDYASTMQKVARLAVPFFADWCAVDLVEADGSLRRVAVVHADPAKLELARELERRFPSDLTVPRGVSNVLRTGTSEMVADIPDAAIVASAKDPEHLRILRALGLKSYLCVPVTAHGKTVGAVTFVAADSNRRFDAADLALAEDLARRAGIAMDNARLYSEAREAERRKDEFLAMLAHELRNPLAPIRNALHIMNQPGTDATAVEGLREMMERQVQHMTRMVDDLLDVSRITRGKIALRKEVVDLAWVVNRVVEAIRPLIDDRQQQLTVDLPPEPLCLEADPTRLDQILANLLNNAAKYTDHGGHIWLSARQIGDELVLRVKDNGVGIAANMLTLIFEPFVQSDRVLHHSEGGLGIGLTLVRSLVEMHGGSVTAQSDGQGKGSEFIVRLPALSQKHPVAVARSPKEDGAPLGAGPQRRILVVDDNVDGAESLAMLLKTEGHEVRVAHDGPAALAAIDADPPELVFLDIGMPVMSGYEVAQRLRQRPGLENLRLVAMTGWGQEEDRRRSQEAGFDQHLVKPVELDVLRKLLAFRTRDQAT